MDAAPDGRPRLGSGREVALDAAALAVVSVAICVAADRLLWMSVLVPAVFAARVWLWRRWVGAGRLGAEGAFLALCVLVGAANDWNTVVAHDVYRYTVPTFGGVEGALPLWMLLYWGLILRFVAALGAWRGLGEGAGPRDRVGVGGHRRDDPWTRLALMLALVLATRQAIFRWSTDPVASWLPFALAAVLWAAVLGLNGHDRRLALLAVTVGTAVEAAYITVGGLHEYDLGLVGGVPLWIVLWWPLGVLVWKELSGRVHRRLEATAPYGAVG